MVHLPIECSTDEALCEKTKFQDQTLYLQNAILSSHMKCLVFCKLTINLGLLALQTSKA